MMACFNVLAFVLMLLPFEGKEGSVARDSAAVAAVAAGQQQVLSDSIPQSFMDKIDYYYKAWFHSRTEGEVQADSAMLAESGKHPVTCSDSLYLARLDSLQSGVPLSFNDIVRNYIEMYTVKRPQQVASMLGLGEYYFPIFEAALDAECMPLELKYLPVIESALNPRALSRAGACGLWQFMYSTGKMYKLEINSFVDERRDPFRSTQAAVDYLNDLYGIYEDWILVIAAYNCGPGNVNKAIRRSGGKKNYWDIYYYLPRETRGYVPAFIAVNYVFNYYKEHGIYPLEPTLPPLCDTIVVGEGLHFEQIASQMDLSVEELRDLNPQFRADVIPAGCGKTYALQLPYDYVGMFIDRQDSIFAYNRSKYFNDNYRTADPKARIKVHAPARLVVYVPENKLAQYKNKANYAGKVDNTASAPQVELLEGEYVLYTVKSGENLWTIAKKYPGVSNRDIMKWNGLSDADVRRIKPGQQLKIKI